jgi:aryl-alcohol dehydrogenase-like predicted oxidoreductase
MGLVSEQSLYNLKDRMVELEVIPACKEFGLGLIPYSPLAGGLLAGSVSTSKEGRRSSENIQKGIEKYEKQLEAYETFCQKFGANPANVALAWLIHNPVVTSPIIGPRTIEQLENSIHALDIVLSDEDMVRLDKLWPGPGGQAPEAYAW